MKLGRAIKSLHSAELKLAEEFKKTGDRHPSDHDIFHLCHTLAEQCLEHARQLETASVRYETDLDHNEPSEGWDQMVTTLRGSLSKPLADTPQAGLLLLRDLKNLYVLAQEINIDWTIVSQGAKAARDKDLVDLAYLCAAETGTQIKWLLTRIKISAPQPLTVD